MYVDQVRARPRMIRVCAGLQLITKAKLTQVRNGWS